PRCRRRRLLQFGSTSAGSFPTRRGRFRSGRQCVRWECDAITGERFHFVEVRRVFFPVHRLGRPRTELCAVLQNEGGNICPYLKGDERETRCALVLARSGILRAVEIKKWSTCAVRGSQGEDRRRRGLSHGNTLRLGLIVGDGGKGYG